MQILYFGSGLQKHYVHIDADVSVTADDFFDVVDDIMEELSEGTHCVIDGDKFSKCQLEYINALYAIKLITTPLARVGTTPVGELVINLHIDDFNLRENAVKGFYSTGVKMCLDRMVFLSDENLTRALLTVKDMWALYVPLSVCFIDSEDDDSLKRASSYINYISHEDLELWQERRSYLHDKIRGGGKWVDPNVEDVRFWIEALSVLVRSELVKGMIEYLDLVSSRSVNESH